MRHEGKQDDRSIKNLLRWVFEGVESALNEIGDENEGVLETVHSMKHNGSFQSRNDKPRLISL